MSATNNAAAKKTAAERRSLNESLWIAMNDRKALNCVRGPLGHGVIFHADKAEQMAAIDARIADLQAALARLS